MELDGKTALVTGGAVRIGAAISEALASRGCRVLIHFRNSAEAAEALAAALGDCGRVPCMPIQGDLSSEDGCRNVIEEAWRAAGRLDILVNNAAVFHRDPLSESSEQKMVTEFNTNLLAPMFLMREFAGRAGSGRIINLLDSRIAGTGQGCVPYFLSKRALADVTLSAAREYAPAITVNGVAPGPVLPPAGGSDKAREEAGELLLGRRPRPADVAEAVVFLVTSDSITGQIIYVDGGQHLTAD